MYTWCILGVSNVDTEFDMHTNSEVTQWGNGLAIRLNKTIAEAASLARGSKVTIEVDKNGVHICAVKPQRRLALPISEAVLLRGISPELAHSDELAIPLKLELGEE